MDEEAPLLTAVAKTGDGSTTNPGRSRSRGAVAAVASLLLVALAAIAAVVGGGDDAGGSRDSGGFGVRRAGLGMSRLDADEEATGPLVSIVVTTYNVEEYVELAINSALDQTYRNIELVVVDDHSNDGGEEPPHTSHAPHRAPILFLSLSSPHSTANQQPQQP